MSSIALADQTKEVAAHAEIISNIVLKGDLSGLSPVQRVDYYNRMCSHVGLDPVSQPFSLLNLQGKLVLYANKSATEQLRALRGVSVTDLTGQMIGDIYVVTAKGIDGKGRTDVATGAVNVAGLKGDAMANAIMKTETKAKRRLTLSLCGLGMLDESEIETIPDAKPVSSITLKVENQDGGNGGGAPAASKGKPAAKASDPELIKREKAAMESLKVNSPLAPEIVVDKAREDAKAASEDRRAAKITDEEYVKKLEAIAKAVSDEAQF